MGLFSSTKIYVSSTVYNLAGPEEDRPNYLKSLVLGNIISEVDFDIAETLQSGYIKGPGIQLRNFLLWAEIPANYGTIGVPLGGFTTSYAVDNSILIANIAHDPAATVNISEVVVEGADIFYWADQWMLVNYPAEEPETTWSSDYDETAKQVVVTLIDETEHRFTPVGFDQSANYIYTTYNISTPGTAGPVVTGSTTVLALTDPWPDTTGYTLVSSGDVVDNTNLTTTTTAVSTYSDGRPATTVTSSTSALTPWHEIHGIWSKQVYQGQDPNPLVDRTWAIKSTMCQDQTSHVEDTTTTSTATEIIAGGVTKTTVTTVVRDIIVLDRTWRIDTQDVTILTFTPSQMWIYKIGSGIPALDASVTNSSATDQYYPFIPMRLNNVPVDATNFPDYYPLAKRALKKSVSGKYDTLLDNINANKSIADMDYIYYVFGVSANVIENDCRIYMYDYFKALCDAQTYTALDLAAYKTANAAAVTANNTYQAWKSAQYNPSSPLFGTPEPPVAVMPSIPTNGVRITTIGVPGVTLTSNYDIRITWQAITETTGTGLIDSSVPRANGEIWWETGFNEFFATAFFSGRTIFVDGMDLHCQIDQNTWKTLNIRGMVHRNYIYGGKYVEIGLSDAVNDADESGFIIPLHQPTYKLMPLTRKTQMSTACCFAVINCYVVKKTGFFGSFFFKIILFIAIIAISVYFPPAVGLLGTNVAIGAALGLTGLAAAIVGAVANFIAAALLLKVVNVIAIAVFGAKIGAIIGAIVGFAAMTFGSGIFNVGYSFSSIASHLGNITSIIKMASAVGGGIEGYIKGAIQDLSANLTELGQEANTESLAYQNLYAENVGYDRAQFDPTALTGYTTLNPEDPQTFLNRTQMTGSDNIDLQMSLISNFADISLDLSLP